MKKIITSVFALFLSISLLHAQNFLDKLDNAMNKVDRAASSANRAGQTGNKLMSFFSKDKKGNKTESVKGTLVNVKGGNFNVLSKLNEKIKTCKGVEETKLSYSKEGSVIAVKTKLSPEELLNAIKNAGAVTDENISGLDESGISLNL